MELELVFHTAFMTWSDVPNMCFSRDRNAYARAKRHQTRLAVHELKKQVDRKNVFPDGAVSVSYEWHTTHKYDLGNLIAGEKVVDDVINEYGLWSDDSQITRVDHQRVADTADFVKVTISSADDPQNIDLHRNRKSSIKYSVYFEHRCIGTYKSIRGVCRAIGAKPAQVQAVLDGKYRTVCGCEVRAHG